jgi:hypothetical protein
MALHKGFIYRMASPAAWRAVAALVTCMPHCVGRGSRIFSQGFIIFPAARLQLQGCGRIIDL